jgi:glycolate oxidase
MTLIAPYPSIAQAIRTVPEIIRRDLQPLAVEFMEADAIELTERQLNRTWPVKGPKAFLMIVLELGHDADGPHLVSDRGGPSNASTQALDARVEEMAAVCEAHGAGDIFVADTAEKQREVLDFRSQMYEALKPWCMEILDIVVPRSEIAGHVEAVHALEREYGAWLPTYGHAGDGNVHSHIMRVGFKDGKPDFSAKADWDALYPVLRQKLHEDARRRGGLVSGEHGIGLAKKELLEDFVGPAQIAIMRGIKKMLDPNDILNPGKMF